MVFFRSRANPYVICQCENGDIKVENPDVTCEYLENGRIIYCSQAKLVFSTKKDIFNFIGVSPIRSEAIRNMNEQINKKVSAKDRTNFLDNNYFLLIN